jgi:hypothetical protein
MTIPEHLQLINRVRQRNVVLWTPLDWGGIMEPLAAEQEALLALHQPSIENYLIISGDKWDLQESQRDRTFELDQAEIEQDRQLADEKVALGYAQLAIKQATDDYLLAVRLYECKVKALLQGVREYAAQVELEQLAVERDRAELAVEREVLHLDEINARIYYEAIQRAQVEADIARNQLEVVKAQVRLIMSEIEAGKAEIALVEAQVQEAMATAEKATLQADIAMIYAEILSKYLSEIRLDVGRKEIAQGFAVIQAKLEDMQAIWDARLLIESIREETEKEVLQEINKTIDAEKDQEDLRLQEAQKNREVFDYEVQETTDSLEEERILRGKLLAAKIKLADAREVYTLFERDKGTWVELLLNKARRWTYKHQYRMSDSFTRSTELISGD